MKNEKELYQMKLHEELKIDDSLFVRRVPGGWLYETWSFDNDGETLAVASSFVPFHNEFQ